MEIGNDVGGSQEEERERLCRKKNVGLPQRPIDPPLLRQRIRLDSRDSAFIYAHANQLFISGNDGGKIQKRLTHERKMSENEECQSAAMPRHNYSPFFRSTVNKAR